jgi:Zn-dependent protease
LFDSINLLIRVPIVLLALTIHEFCHGYFAYRMGDPTAYRAGRLTLNPIRHLDPLGTICLMFAWIGWAKPVPINPLNFRDWRKGVLVSTAAGPASNLVQAVVFGLILRVALMVSPPADGVVFSFVQNDFWSVVRLMCLFGVLINVGLAVFNFLPLYPLDGFHITHQLMRPETQRQFARTAQYGPIGIAAVVLLSVFGRVNILGHLVYPPAKVVFTYAGGLPEDLAVVLLRTVLGLGT